MVDKIDPNARLEWNNKGLNNYNVFKGTSPHTMRLIGNTSGITLEDSNVLHYNVTYYYTIDEPGQ